MLTNRHERRKRAALDRADRQRRMSQHLWATLREESNGLLEIDIMPFDDISAHRQRHEMANAVICWIRNSPNPKCMLCDFRWLDHRRPPARFFFARAWHDGPKSWLVGGICPGCDRRPDLVEMFNTELRQHFPGGQLVDGSHQAPGRMQ
jgi:hypothetical protein